MFFSLLGAWPLKGVTTALRSTVFSFHATFEHIERFEDRVAVPLGDLPRLNAALILSMM